MKNDIVIFFLVLFSVIFVLGCDWKGKQTKDGEIEPQDFGNARTGVSFRERFPDANGVYGTNFGITEELNNQQGRNEAYISVQHLSGTYIDVVIDTPATSYYDKFYMEIPRQITSDDRVRIENLNVPDNLNSSVATRTFFIGLANSFGTPYRFSVKGYTEDDSIGSLKEVNYGYVVIYPSKTMKVHLVKDFNDNSYFDSAKEKISSAFKQSVETVTFSQQTISSGNHSLGNSRYVDSLKQIIRNNVSSADYYVVLLNTATNSTNVTISSPFIFIPFNTNSKDKAEIGRLAAHELAKRKGLSASNTVSSNNLMRPAGTGINLNFSQWQGLRGY
ncbi:MAG: hypothetical protein LBI42_03650 [Chitinispirillales bacterium]|jgi:hypothetical protein|nr:hypothetical protein [Chitinispirillales bacterium]